MKKKSIDIEQFIKDYQIKNDEKTIANIINTYKIEKKMYRK